MEDIFFSMFLKRLSPKLGFKVPISKIVSNDVRVMRFLLFGFLYFWILLIS